MSLVNFPWPGGERRSIPALWLRDNCPCESCRVASTNEHRMLISSVPIDLEPVATTQVGDTVIVDWGDHVSRYSADWMAMIATQVARAHPMPRSWRAGFEPSRVDMAELDDRAATVAFLERFVTDGAAIITNTPTEPGSLVDIIRRWAPTLEVPFALVHDVFVDPAGYNIAHTAEALPPHNDMASRKHPPSGQVLHMLVNDADGGDSIIVDGFAVLAQLDEADLAVLSDVAVGFRQFSDTVETWATEPLVRRRSDGSFVSLRYSNQLLQPLDPANPTTASWYEAYHRLSTAMNDRANQTDFRLDGGDFLMLDAHRVLHGRAEFSPGTGQRHLQDVYFDSDDLRNELARLIGVER